MKVLYVTNSEKRVKELKEVFKKYVDVASIDFLFDLEYDVNVTTYSKDLEQNVRKRAQNVWKKEKENYDYVVAEQSGLFSEYAPNILGVESDTWWPGTQRDRNEALVNLFSSIKEREIHYKSVAVAINKKGDVTLCEGFTYGFLARKVKERNGEGYDSVFIMDDGKYLSHHSADEIKKLSATNISLTKLAQKL